MRLHWFVLIMGLCPSIGSANLLHGDWGSAGVPPVIYLPAYEFRYECQAELTDSVDRQGDGKGVAKGRPYRLYTMAHFSLTPGHIVWNGSPSGTWIAKLLDAEDLENDEVMLKAPPSDAFSFAGSDASLIFQRGADAAHDKVTLYLSVPAPLDHYYVTGSAKDLETRAAAILSARAEATLFRGEGESASLPSMIERSLYVECTKVK